MQSQLSLLCKKFVLIYYQPKNCKSECHSYMVLTRLAGLASRSDKEVPEWRKVRLRLLLPRVPPGQMLSSRNLFPSPCAVSASIWPWTCQASCVLEKLLVKGNTCLCPTFILLLTSWLWATAAVVVFMDPWLTRSSHFHVFVF